MRSPHLRPPAPIVLIVGLALACPLVALAFTLAAEAPRERDGRLWVSARLDDPFPERVEESLGRGMPATLQWHAELWRKRTGWFDRLEQSFDGGLRIRYDVWTEHYLVERAGAPTVRVSTLDSLESVLARPIALPVGRLDLMQPQGRYYVVVYATLKPLAVEDVEEVEGWLSGEVRGPSRGGIGVITELPSSVFDAVRNFTGFGDLRTRAITKEFRVQQAGVE